MACWAYCNRNSPLFDIFGTAPVPIRSIVPVVPREEGCPLCYIVLGDQLEVSQAEALAQQIYRQWQPECESIEQARRYILDGLPLRTTHFFSCGTDDWYMLKHGAALNMALKMQEGDRA